MILSLISIWCIMEEVRKVEYEIDQICQKVKNELAARIGDLPCDAAGEIDDCLENHEVEMAFEILMSYLIEKNIKPIYFPVDSLSDIMKKCQLDKISNDGKFNIRLAEYLQKNQA